MYYFEIQVYKKQGVFKYPETKVRIYSEDKKEALNRCEKIMGEPPLGFSYDFEIVVIEEKEEE